MSDDRNGVQAHALPRMRLDELLDELQNRIGAVRATRDRVHGLLEAVLDVGRDLDLETVLRRIVESAVSLVDAEYGALGVIGEEGRLARFLPVGMDPEAVEAMGPFPAGHGILGLVIRDPQPLRLSDLTSHEHAHGFPPGHPPMRTFVGVPIRVRDEVFGNLYLTEKRGGAEFDEEDEAVLRTLAAAAGVAIDNARLYDDARRRERWLTAGSELTRGLLSGIDPATALSSFTANVRDMTGADLVTVAAPVPGTGDLMVEAADGGLAADVRGVVLSGTTTIPGKVYATGQLVVSPGAPGMSPDEHGLGPAIALGPSFVLPLGATGHVRGVLHVAQLPGGAGFGDAAVRMVAGFADHAALALEVAERRRDAELLTVFQDRDRIARDLHDLAIQRLFATGMTLQSVTRLVERPEAVDRIMQAVDDLDDTIKVIRSTIFSLRVRDRIGGTGLRTAILRETDAAAEALGHPPTLRMDGLLDTLVCDEIADHVPAVLREALSNAARHAAARRVDVVVEIATGTLRLRVTDDGRGIGPAPSTGNGLGNLAERAEALGGTCTVAPRPDGGTVVTWAVPLDATGTPGT